MAQQYILRINSDGEPRWLYRFDAQSKSCEVQAVAAWDEEPLKQPGLIVLLPASWVYLTETHIASKSAELLAKSIPFAIEEELSNDVEDNYYAFESQDNGSQTVVAMAKHNLDALNQNLKDHDIQVSAIHSENDWLPMLEHSIYLWLDQNQGLIRFGVDQVMRVQPDQLQQLLSVFGADQQQLYCNQTLADKVVGGLTVKELSAANCCAHLLQNPAIDLYVNELQETPSTDSAGQWRLPAVLAMLLLLSWVGIQGLQWYQLRTDVADLKQQQKQVLLNAFPDAVAAELVDPYAAIQSRLRIQSNSNQNQSILIEALHPIGITSQREQLIQIRSLRMVDNKLEIQVAAPAMSTINQYHQALQQAAGTFMVQIGVNELADDGGFRSILTMVPR